MSRPAPISYRKIVGNIGGDPRKRTQEGRGKIFRQGCEVHSYDPDRTNDGEMIDFANWFPADSDADSDRFIVMRTKCVVEAMPE